MARQTRFALTLFTLGLLLRLPALPLRGIVDTHQWEAWALQAVDKGIAEVYGPSDRDLLERARVTGRGWAQGLLTMEYPRTRFPYLDGVFYVDYPPGSVILLWLVGKSYRFLDPAHRWPSLLTVLVNLLPLLGTIGIAWVLRRAEPGDPGLRRALAFWWNPAVLLGFMAMGYQDAVFGACAVAGIAAVVRGRLGFGVAWIAAAGLLKPQGALLLPPIAALVLFRSGARTALRCALVGLGVAILLFAPFWTQSHLLSALHGTLRPLEESSLSANSLNLWWVAGWIMQSAGRGHPFGLARPTTLAEFETWAGFDPQIVSRGVIGIGTLVNLVLLLRRPNETAARLPLAVVIQTLLYAALSTSVHENHAFLALLAATLLPEGFAPGRRVRWSVNALIFLNLFLLQGIGSDFIPDHQLHRLRRATGIDLSVLVAVGSLVLLGLSFYWAARRPRAPANDQRLTQYGR